MIRIDYYGGAYGQFLKYIVNRYIYKLESAKNFIPFDSYGSSHNITLEYANESKVDARHYSFEYNDCLPSKDDTLVRIAIDKKNIYHVYYNVLARAGDCSVDLKNPEINTIEKIKELKNQIKLNNPTTGEAALAKLDRNQLIKDFGIRKDYPRSAIRNYYYAALREDQYFLDNVNEFIEFDTKEKIKFPVSSFTSLDQFAKEIKQLSKIIINRYVDLDDSFSQIYNMFLDKNIGIQSQIRCKKIIDDIISNNSVEFDINILEEAWINCNITQIFDIHDGISCFGDRYPSNTSIICKEINERLK